MEGDGLDGTDNSHNTGGKLYIEELKDGMPHG